jgi:tetraacyldisaccharide 4'-kinase
VSPQRYDAGLLAETDAGKLASQPKPNVSEPATPQSKEAAAKVDKPSAQTEQTLALVKPEAPVLTVGVEPAKSSGELTPNVSPAEKSPAKSAPPLHVHLLDDGFQHRQLARDVNILLLNQRDWKDWLLPAGNLREPVEAISRADVLALPANEPELEVALHFWGWDRPVWLLSRSLEIPEVNGPVAAFCGIAHPNQFFEGLQEAGLEVSLRLAFPDHYTYTVSVLEELIAQAREMNVAAVITTEKDLVRMGNLALLFPKSMPLTTARLHIKIEDQNAAIDWLINRLEGGGS